MVRYYDNYITSDDNTYQSFRDKPNLMEDFYHHASDSDGANGASPPSMSSRI